MPQQEPMPRLLRTMSGDQVLPHIGCDSYGKGSSRGGNESITNDDHAMPCRSHDKSGHGGDFQTTDAVQQIESGCVCLSGEMLPQGPANDVQLSISPGVIQACALAG